MRFLFAVLYDCLAALLALLLAPLRLARRRPDWLLVELTGPLPWRTPRRFLGFGRPRPAVASSVRQVQRRLEAAARDPRVKGVVVKVEGVTAPGARLEALRHALRRFREAGKQVVFHARAVDSREYALMACGSRVVLAPGGRLDLKGWAAELVVLGRTLDKFGIKAHFLRRAEFKTAPELFTASEVSAPQRETTRAILDELLARTVQAISEGRGRPVEEVRQWIDQGPYTNARARELGLIDAIADGEELETLLEAEGAGKVQFQPLTTYRGSNVLCWPRYRPLRRRPRVALVRVDGVVKLGESLAAPLMPRAAGSDTIVQALRRAREDRSMRAIVLAIDSRGGSSLASELVLRAVRRAAEKKPVVAFFDQVAASGGYMIALGASSIVAAPSSLTGSIGVFGGKFELSGLLDRLGVGREVLRVGANAALESPFEPWTEGERAALDREIDQAYRDFLALVAQGRKRPLEEIEPLAGGRVYTGRRAHELGLVDELGGFEQAVAKAAGLAGIVSPEVVAVDAAGSRLPRLPGLRAQDLAAALLPLSSERIFALEEGWLRLRPRP